MGLAVASLLLPSESTRVDAQIGETSLAGAGNDPPPTLEINLRAVLELPTDVPTIAPLPTLTPAQVTPSINDCSSVDPGEICRVPFPPIPTETPLPSCLRMDYLTPGAWCIWPDATPTISWWTGS
jgi:hypothetical protein